MPRHLLASVALAALATPAFATTTVTTKVTTPLQTATAANGSPDSIVIAQAGSVVLTGGGTGVTQNSNHAVTINGEIGLANANGAIGILSQAATTGDITNAGSIKVDEPYTPTDTDNDGDLDGPFALGSNRAGIRTLGAHVGKITNSGTIGVEGNDSAGILLGGPLTGAFVHDGKTSVLGDRSTGVLAGDITGHVRLAGTITAVGKDAVGTRLSGNVTGAVVVQGSLVATGYRNTTAPSDPSKLDADDLLQGGSALVVEGDVTGGIVLAVPPKDQSSSNADEDADGIEDAKEGSASVIAYGRAPAMVIGATDHALSIGPVAGTASGFGLQIDGTVEGRGVYSGIEANGLVIGGRGGAVSIANGIGIAGGVAAVASGASATALRLGAGATTPQIQVSGVVSASGGGATGAASTAIVVDSGASVGTIRNSGTIKATAGGANGFAGAIVDHSGSVTLVANSGAISATGAAAGSGRNVAIDLSANVGGATINQTQVASGVAAPSIAGDVRLGTGDDVFSIADGTMNGATSFGAGNNRLTLSGDAVQSGDVTFGSGNDIVALAGTSAYSGRMDFGGGADSLSLSDGSSFAGTLANSGNLAVQVNGGMLSIARPAAVASLAVGQAGTLGVTLSKIAGEGTAYSVAGTASFASGSKLALKLADVSSAEGSYTVLVAGTLQGRSNIAADTALVPYMFKASLAQNAPADRIVVDVARKSTQELGLNRSQSAGYNAIFQALGKDQDVENVFLGITDGDAFRHAVGSMLPDHAGGAFEGTSLGIRSLARKLMDPGSPLVDDGRLSVGMDLGVWGSRKKQRQSAAYSLNGYSWSLGGEYRTGLGQFGLSAAYLWNQHSSGDSADVKSNAYELAASWRASWKGFSAFARGSFGKAKFEGKRLFTGATATKNVERTIKGKWDGNFTSLAGGVAFEGGGRHFFFRPSVSADYIRLKEDGYSETGGGDALDLAVDGRTSDELGINPALAIGYDFTGRDRDDESWLRVEGEGGWRAIAKGGLGDTTARFKDGNDFTLTGEGATSGWFARLGVFGGMVGMTIGGQVSAEERHQRIDLAFRGTLRVGL